YPPNGVNAVVRSGGHTSPRTFLVMQYKFTRPLQQRGDKCFLAVRGQRGHGVTMKERGGRLRRFMRRNVSGDKVNSTQVAAFTSSLGQRQMALVNGVESTTEKPDIHMRSCVARRASCARSVQLM